MFPASLLRFELQDGAVEPAYLDDRAAGLARKLLLAYQGFAGRPYRDLREGLGLLSDLDGEDPRVVAGLRRVIEESMELWVESPIAPRRIREALFELGRRDRGIDPDPAVAAAARELHLPVESLQENLYADLREERRLRFPGGLPAPAEAVSRYNFRLLEGLLFRAERVRLEVREGARAALRFAKLHGLLVEILEEAGEDALRLEITGPLSIFRSTLKYGRALARFVPAGLAGGRARLEADLNLRGKRARLVVGPQDRLQPPHRPPRLFDSKLEERFFRDFLLLKSRWEISREASLVRTRRGFFLPDFTFRLRPAGELSADLEIVGFWTRDYLERKRALLRELAPRRLIVCVDERLCCDDLPRAQGFITFARRVPAGEVLRALEELPGR